MVGEQHVQDRAFLEDTLIERPVSPKAEWPSAMELEGRRIQRGFEHNDISRQRRSAGHVPMPLRTILLDGRLSEESDENLVSGSVTMPDTASATC